MESFFSTGRDSNQKDPWIEFQESTNLDRKKNYILIFTNLSLEFSVSTMKVNIAELAVPVIFFSKIEISDIFVLY